MDWIPTYDRTLHFFVSIVLGILLALSFLNYILVDYLLYLIII